jgi:hypothetical protein
MRIVAVALRETLRGIEASAYARGWPQVPFNAWGPRGASEGAANAMRRRGDLCPRGKEQGTLQDRGVGLHRAPEWG